MERVARTFITYALLLLTLALISDSMPAVAQQTDATDAFDAYILRQMKEKRIPGATVVVAHRGKIVKERGYGFANLEWEAPATPETVYEIASVTKIFTATAAMMLVEEGRLELDAPVTRYLDDTPKGYSGITVRHLLTHTSGLPADYLDTQKLFGPSPLRYTVDMQLADLFAKPLTSEPGTIYKYNNSGIFLLGAVIAQVSGMSYEEFVRTRIFEPAAMAQSSFIDADAVVPRRAQSYTLRDGELVRWSIEQNAQAMDGNSYGGILSSAVDLQHFDEALRTDRLLRPETKQQMFEPHQLPDGSFGSGRFSRMALGWWIRDDLSGRRCASHLGATGAAFFHCPDDEFFVVFLSNLTGGYNHLGDRGAGVDLRHGIAERAVQTYLERSNQ